MKKTGYDMLYLTVCAVNKIKPDSDKIKNMDMEKLYQMCQFHKLTAIVCMALESAGILNKKFTEAKSKAIRKNILLDAEREKICADFEKNHIWYMPLKGVILKEMYPKIGMRQMADNDILYDRTGQKQVMNYMKKCGYTAESVGKCHHDTYMKPPIYNFEMHTELFSENYDKKIYAYYSDVRNRLVKDNGKNYAYHFTDEDFYVYMTAHEYKHYSGGGTGLRSLLDCYVYISKKGELLNRDYINRQIKMLGITDFERERRMLSEKVFSAPALAELTGKETEMLEYYLFSGAYGTMHNVVNSRMNMLSQKTGSNSKLRYVWSRIFPPMDFYKQYFPFFYRHKLLIPLAWAFRLVRGVTFRRKRVKNELHSVYRLNKKTP